jgi:nitrile hydratase
VNGIHDIGGMHGLGPIAPLEDEPVFHHGWEGRTLALNLLCPTRANIDGRRHERERFPGDRFLVTEYYERWFESLCSLLVKEGTLTPEELASGKADPAAPKATPRLAAANVDAAFSAPGNTYARELGQAPVFEVGGRVRTRRLNPAGHTRLPRYARGAAGIVVHWHGAHVFPDSAAHFRGEDPQHLYTVRFSAAELWGESASPRDFIHLDLWEPYLERA